MAIEIGATITAISQRDIVYQDGDPPANQTLYVRDVTFRPVGLPAALGLPPSFTVLVMDATQWDSLEVGGTYTISIAVP